MMPKNKGKKYCFGPCRHGLPLVLFNFCIKSSSTSFLHLSVIFSSVMHSFFVPYFLLSCDLVVAKLRPASAQGGASSHSRLQRCMRRARSLQQRMQLQQRQESAAGNQQLEQEQQQFPKQPRYHLSSAQPIRRRTASAKHTKLLQLQTFDHM